MADKRGSFKRPNPWEVIAAFFGYFAVAKEVPDILRTLQIPKIFPICIKSKLLEWVSSSDFWLLLAFTFLTAVLLLYLLFRKEPPEPPEKSDKEKIIEDVSKTFRRNKIIRTIRSLGLVLIREFLLDLMNVGLYGTFTRPPSWPERPTHFISIDRITFESGEGIEVQYPRNYSALSICKHPKNDDKYGPSESVQPTWSHIKLLMVGSNFFPFWFISYLAKRPYIWLSNRLHKQ